MKKFSATIEIIGVNPYIIPPEKVLLGLFKDSGKSKGPIQVKGTLNGHTFTQTLVKYAGFWRLYLNGSMRKAAGIDVGDRAQVELVYDPAERKPEMHPQLQEALQKNKKALAVFESLPPSRQKEIVRYIGLLKSQESVEKNVKRAVDFLTGKGRFIGRDKP